MRSIAVRMLFHCAELNAFFTSSVTTAQYSFVSPSHFSPSSASRSPEMTVSMAAIVDQPLRSPYWQSERPSGPSMKTCRRSQRFASAFFRPRPICRLDEMMSKLGRPGRVAEPATIITPEDQPDTWEASRVERTSTSYRLYRKCCAASSNGHFPRPSLRNLAIYMRLGKDSAPTLISTKADLQRFIAAARQPANQGATREFYTLAATTITRIQLRAGPYNRSPRRHKLIDAVRMYIADAHKSLSPTVIHPRYTEELLHITRIRSIASPSSTGLIMQEQLYQPSPWKNFEEHAGGSRTTLRLGQTEYQTPLSRSPLPSTLTSSCRCTRRACGLVSFQRARKGRSLSCCQSQASPLRNHRRTGRFVCWTQRARFSKESSVTASKPLLRALEASQITSTAFGRGDRRSTPSRTSSPLPERPSRARDGTVTRLRQEAQEE
ncbi:unnamed protein product [Trichogramma brassicae]|uniref:Uncharacterized protein n=1 Tax=Trichogramma brassicae TaxID=86971 RepID=A0A6H5J220_9HYME|nr:unnamed protein product [Trichogramma brassicae]